MTKELFHELQHASDENLLNIEEARAEGRYVIGYYCLYSPMEIAVAADAIPVPLCGTRNDPIAAAEEILPRNLCPLIKSCGRLAGEIPVGYPHLDLVAHEPR